MDDLYNKILKEMDVALRILEGRVPAPRRVPYKSSFVFRYVEKTLHQALVQKLARMVSGLRAARLLMERGFFQEQAALQRMLDETEEDVMFLTSSVISNKPTSLHKRYLDSFYKEEFDAETPLESTQDREMVPRKKIRAYIASLTGEVNPSRAIQVSRSIHKAYSGYVHGASPHIMDMYGGNPPRFHTRGMAGTPLHRIFRKDLRNYFYRAILSFASCAMAFGEELLFEHFQEMSMQFERQAGEDFLFRPRGK